MGNTMKRITIGSVILVIGLIVLTASLQLKPIQKENEVTFRWIGIKNNHILQIDDNKDFTSPNLAEYIQGKSFKTNLEPGTWYWKLDNNPPREFKISSTVALSRTKE